MNNPGLYNLGDLALTVALTGEVITAGANDAGGAQAFLDDLDGMVAASIFCAFAYGSGGTSCAVTVQTTLDDVNWIDAARFDFATASSRKAANLSGLTPEAVAAIAALSMEGVNDGVFGHRWRAVVTSVGTYANTTVSVRLNAR